MPRRINTAAKLNLKNIHHEFSSESSFEEQISTILDGEKDSSIPSDTTITTTFEDALQAIETFSRPTSTLDIQALQNTIVRAIIKAKDDEQKWKLLLLTILRKRYHMKAPEAKSLKREQKESSSSLSSPNDSSTTGHGERLTFYTSFLCLYYFSLLTNNNDNVNQVSVPNYMTENCQKACQCLAKLTISAGGTRDICAFIEHLVYLSLLKNGMIDILNKEGKKRGLAAATVQTVQSKNTSSSSPSFSVLDDFIKTAAELLDRDFELIKLPAGSEKINVGNTTTELQSTINTFIPHHDRGTDVRKLTQSMAEIMIWSATNHSSTDKRFMDAMKTLSSSSTSVTTTSLSTDSSSNDDTIIAAVHTIQTSIRRFRKVLNESSRKKGFSLCSSYSMDPSSISLSMVKRGREGDVMALKKIARKKLDNRTMTLISKRSADPSKAIPISCVRSFCRNWTPLDAGDKGDDEIVALELAIQEATIMATIKLLQQKVQLVDSGLDVVVGSLDDKIECDCAATLVACALSPGIQWDAAKNEQVEANEKVKVSLHIGDKRHTISTKEEAMSLLNEICTRQNGPTPATTKDVQNLIERHLVPNSHLILMTSTDVKIEQRVLSDLQMKKSTVHCHLMDDFQYRMNREKAKVGDVTVTLAWDNQCDLDLHCKCPNGDHISYSRKEGGGGYLDVDMNVGGDSREPVENIFFGDAEKGIEAAKGKYKVIVQNYAYHGNEIKYGEAVPWRLRVVMNGKIYQYSGECVGTGTASDVTAVEFEYNGRTEPLPEKVGSALDSSNLVSVTSSTGSTIDSLLGLLSVAAEHEELAAVEELVRTEESDENDMQIDVDETDDEGTDNDETGCTRPLMANENTFHITNKDRLYLNLSKLPELFKMEVNRSFGSMSLLEFTASDLSKRLIADKVPIEDLKKAGYQDEILAVVKEKMLKFGI